MISFWKRILSPNTILNTVLNTVQKCNVTSKSISRMQKDSMKKFPLYMLYLYVIFIPLTFYISDEKDTMPRSKVYLAFKKFHLSISLAVLRIEVQLNVYRTIIEQLSNGY